MEPISPLTIYPPPPPPPPHSIDPPPHPQQQHAEPQPQSPHGPAAASASPPISARAPSPHLRTTKSCGGAGPSSGSAAPPAFEVRQDVPLLAAQHPSQPPSHSRSHSHFPSAPYSPTRAELVDHPIRRRLTLRDDDDDDREGGEGGESIDTGLRFATTAAATAAEEDLRERSAFLHDQAHLESKGNMTETEIKKGDAAAYSWGGDKKGGTVTEVAKEGHVEMETARGNTVTKDAKPDDPAIRLERAGHDVVKNASEVTKEKEGESHNEGGVQKTVKEDEKKEEKDDEDEKEEEEEEQEEEEDEDAADEEGPKTGDKRAAEPQENGEEPAKKKKGRPAKSEASGASKKEPAKKRAPKKAATESGEPRRSGRVAAKS